MVSEKDKIGIRRFVKGQLHNEPDLSSLTLGILKKRYLALTGCESLSYEERQILKQAVEEELVKMQENDDGKSEPAVKKPQKKRKKESEDENESEAKKSRKRKLSSSSDSEDEQNCEATNQREVGCLSENKESAAEESDHAEGNEAESRVSGNDSSDEESEKGGDQSPSPEKNKKVNTAKNGKMRTINTSGGKKPPSSDEESESDADSKSEKSEKIRDGDFSADKKEENEKKQNDSDSDSSSLPSLEDERKRSPGKTESEAKKKKTKRKEKNRVPKDEDKAILRLKRYIALCGVRKNYKKLLDGCRSIRSKVAVLKKELEDLGVHGNPTIEKCKKVRLKREEAQELAGLDVKNIITTEGRPRRRGTFAMQKHKDPLSTYQLTLSSDSGSDQEKARLKGHTKISKWANLRGIISDDSDTD